MRVRAVSVLVVAAALVLAAPLGRAAVGPAGAKAYVANADSNDVSVVDLTNMSVITTISVGSEPRGPCATPDGAFVYVPDQFGTIIEGSSVHPSIHVISTSTDQVVDVVSITGFEPYNSAATPNGLFVYVVCKDSDTVSVISTATNTEVASISLATEGGSPEGIAITPDGSKVYVVNRQGDNVEVISTATNTLVGQPIPVNDSSRDARVTADGSKVMIVGESAPVVILTATDTVSPTALEDIGTQRDVAIFGNRAYVTNFSFNPPSEFDGGAAKTKAAPAPGQGSLDIYDLATDTYVESIQILANTPYGVDLLPNGTCAYVTAQDSGSLQSVDLGTNEDVDNFANVGSGPRGLVVVQARPIIDSFFLPKKVAYKKNAKSAAKNSFSAGGFFDTGSKVVDLTAPATLTVGTFDIPVPGLTASPNGRTFTYKAGGLTFVVVKNPFGSSRAKFRLIYKGDLGASVPTDGNLMLSFHNDAVDGACEVLLQKGGFRLGKKRGALSTPNLFVVRAAANVPGGGKDTLSLIVGLATGGVTPANPSDVSVEFGTGLDATIPAGMFTRKGDTYVFKGDVNGITDVTVDYLRETVSIAGKNLNLGTFTVNGQTPINIFVGVGEDDRGVAVRVGRKGNVLKY